MKSPLLFAAVYIAQGGSAHGPAARRPQFAAVDAVPDPQPEPAAAKPVRRSSGGPRSKARLLERCARIFQGSDAPADR